MSEKNPVIVVAGDVSLDGYMWPRETQTTELNWLSFPGHDMKQQPGGAFLIAKMLKIMKKSLLPKKSKIISPNPKDISERTPVKILRTNAKLGIFPRYKGQNKSSVYRLQENLGFTGPKKDDPYHVLPIIKEKRKADLVVIHDVGNGFRSEPDAWPKALKRGERPLILYNMYPPLFSEKLWKRVSEDYQENLILVINADDLRRLGVHISRSLSWEKTAMEFLWEIDHHEKLEPIRKLPHVIVRFELEGVIYYRGHEGHIGSKLFFDPVAVESGFWDDQLGNMKGVSSIFLVTIAAKIASNLSKRRELPRAIEEGIKEGVVKSRGFAINGFGDQNNGPLLHSKMCKRLFDSPDNFDNDEYKIIHRIESVVLPFTDGFKEPDPFFWCILEQKTENNNNNGCEIFYEKKAESSSEDGGIHSLEQTALDIVLKGEKTIECIPVGNFGDLKTIDRAEIEGFRSIKNLMSKYVKSEKFSHPLSVAVFGMPGSGKSFSVAEVAKSIGSEMIQKIDFNVSQFRSLEDLASAFHRVRDISLRGKIPLVFFDEFDSKFENQPLGWLKYFLAPMQDGVFMDSGVMHPIGKSIFVFAGGTCRNFKEFYTFCAKNQSSNNGFGNEKCPDFISRLRGYVNILGPNPVHDNDEAYVIRRAILLRSLIEKKAQNLIDSNREAKIDDSVLRALIKIPEYKHGVRSMEAILEMSMLRGGNLWTKASLPPKDQLELHIDSEMFSKLVSKKKQNYGNPLCTLNQI
ncbi:MAG: AAA family ATPase [Methanosarcinaceae archaeon]